LGSQNLGTWLTHIGESIQREIEAAAKEFGPIDLALARQAGEDVSFVLQHFTTWDDPGHRPGSTYWAELGASVFGPRGALRGCHASERAFEWVRDLECQAEAARFALLKWLKEAHQVEAIVPVPLVTPFDPKSHKELAGSQIVAANPGEVNLICECVRIGFLQQESCVCLALVRRFVAPSGVSAWS
jgi:hypothetical protein